jgi:HD-GYP domain-containing protein (c-di-GMP phosphodiesterase class II)
VLSAGLLLLLFLPLAQVVAKRISGALERLTADAERIQRLDFSGVGTVRSVFKEIDLLGVAQQTMKTALRERTAALDEVLARQESLLESGTQLSSRRSRDMVVRQTLDSARRLVEAQSGQFWLRGEDGELRLAAWFRDDVADAVAPDLVLAPDTAAADPCMRAAMEKKTVMPGAAPHDFDLGTQRLLLGAEPSSLLAVPVLARGASVMGVLVLTGARDHGAAAPFDPAMARYAETLAAQSGVALENMALLASQRMLMDSLIQLVASAIDAKSEYTAGHCLRVPELARLLAEAACEVTEGPLAAFRFETDDEWREFRVGTWLHDCGKVTTPEYVVDKATKLETLFNRIHEIRTRFEVLLRDAEIDRLKAVLGGTDAAAAQAIFEARRAVLREDFAFVANCNVGGEHMPQEYVERLRGIGATTWLRHFDDRLGLSHIEEERLAGQPPAPLPATERLLADKPEHIVPRTEHDRYDDRYGFRMKVPEHLYNFGELYNLSIQRGTLTAEERYKVNEHIVQTIVMLDQLPLPPDLQRVPEYAGTHHESLAGDGYPRGLKGGELSIPARIMAIADIFEALTASDRPYKKAKPLSEAVRILETFRARGHIDDDLFKLFLTSGVYLDYARRYLPPEQIDRVDIGAYVGG